MRPTVLVALSAASLFALSGCPAAQSPASGDNGVTIVTTPSELSIPTGGVGSFTVALSNDPGGSVVLNVSCIAGGCGFQPIGLSELFFDSSNFARPKTVLLGDTGFKGRGQSVFQITGGELEPAFVLIIRD